MTFKVADDDNVLKIAKALIQAGSRLPQWQSLHAASVISNVSVSSWRGTFPSYSRAVDIDLERVSLYDEKHSARDSQLGRLQATVEETIERVQAVLVDDEISQPDPAQLARQKYNKQRAILFEAWQLTEEEAIR